jgi:hypothetical protein
MEKCGQDGEKHQCTDDKDHRRDNDLILSVAVTHTAAKLAVNKGRKACAKKDRPHKIHKCYCTLKCQLFSHFGQRGMVRLSIYIRLSVKFRCGREGN